MTDRPLLMIPGPIEVSPAVQAAFSVAPPSHVSGPVIEAFGSALERMRRVWRAAPASQPFVVAGGGTLAMEMAATNVVDPGERVVVVSTGTFGDRMAEMLRRRGAEVVEVGCEPGEVPADEAVASALAAGDTKALFATHVDTSTGVRVDAERLAALAREHGALSVFDGVCATAGEAFAMADWGADVYLTASQKAIGLPPGLALLVASERAVAARAALTAKPPMTVDFDAWRPIMEAYEARRPSYFSTPATNLILALDVALAEIEADTWNGLTGAAARAARHRTAADAMRAAWRSMRLTLLPARPGLAADTLSAILYPEGVDGSLLARVREQGVIVAGGLYPGRQQTYFRVGHMGWVTTQLELLLRTLRALEAALREAGHKLRPGKAEQAAVEVLAAAG